MLLVGLLLAALSAAFASLLIAYNTSGGPDYTVMLFDNDIATLNSLEIFASGLALALIFCLGLWMVGASARRRRFRRQLYAADRDQTFAALGGDEPMDQYGEPGPRGSRPHLFGQ